MRVLIIFVLFLSSVFSASAQEALTVKILCRDGKLAVVEPQRIESLILRGSGRRVEWHLETANCPAALKRFEVRFDGASPFGDTPADKEFTLSELPEPLPATLSVGNREIMHPGEYRYQVFLLDVEGKTLAQSEGRISARVIAPAVSTWGLVLAGVALALFFWALRRRWSLSR